MKCLSLFRIMGLSFLLILAYACVHEPILPVDGGDGTQQPVDTTGNPVDTTGNPNDTTGNPIDTTSQSVGCHPDTVYFERDILPVLLSNCAKSGCHDAVTAEDDVILTDYVNVVSTADIDPFEPEKSELYERITDDDPDDVMPPPPNSTLSAAQIALIRTWILQGAQNLSCEDTGCDTTASSYSATVAPILEANCTGCHSGNAPPGGVDLTSYTGVAQVANSGQLFAVISHQPGSVNMPLDQPKLDECLILKIKSWIDNGAMDN